MVEKKYGTASKACLRLKLSIEFMVDGCRSYGPVRRYLRPRGPHRLTSKPGESERRGFCGRLWRCRIPVCEVQCVELALPPAFVARRRRSSKTKYASHKVRAIARPHDQKRRWTRDDRGIFCEACRIGARPPPRVWFSHMDISIVSPVRSQVRFQAGSLGRVPVSTSAPPARQQLGVSDCSWLWATGSLCRPYRRTTGRS